MKNIIIVLAVFVLASCKKNTTAIQQAEVIETIKSTELSPKDKFLGKLDPTNREFVSVIDSIKPIDFWFDKEGIELVILPANGKLWQEVQLESSAWEEFEGGEIPDTKTVKFSTHIGHAYLLIIRKIDCWQNLINKDHLDIEYVLRYGVLLEADTVKGKIFDKGTYVLSSFTKKSEVDRGRYEIEYFTNYEKFSAAIYEEVRLAKDNWVWVNAAKPVGITLEL